MNTKAISECDLLKESLLGDQNAFGQIIERYQSLICSITYSMTGDLSHSEDLAQETFITAWKHLTSLRNPNSLRSWLCGIARNMVKDFLRKNKNELTANSTSIDEAHNHVRTDSTPLERVLDQEQERLLWEALKEIPPHYREPLILFYREEQSIRLVAENLGKSEEAVRTLLSRGRKMLKEQAVKIVEDNLFSTRPTKVFTIAILSVLPAAAPQLASATAIATVSKGVFTLNFSLILLYAAAALGPLLGLAGALGGARIEYGNAQSERECRFIVKVTVFLVIYILVYGLILLLTIYYAAEINRYVIWFFVAGIEMFLYVMGIAVFEEWQKSRIKEIRIEDGTWEEPEALSHKLSFKRPAKKDFAGSVIGTAIGTLGWILVLCCIHSDWNTLILILITEFLVISASLSYFNHHPKKHWNILILNLIFVIAMNYLVLHLRWGVWNSPVHNSPLTNYDPFFIGINIFLGVVFSFILLGFFLEKHHESA